MQAPSSSSSSQDQTSQQLSRQLSRRTLRIECSDTIALLIDVQELRWLQPFMNGERNLASVAQELSADLSFLSRKVKRMLKLGLLEVSRTEARKGRAIKHYRASADEFFIPEHTGAISTMFEQLNRTRNQQLQDGILEEWMSREDPNQCDWGLHVKLFDQRIGITAAIRPGESWNAVTSNVLAAAYWRTPKLNRADAEWLKLEIERISNELDLRHCDDGDPFLVRLAFAPNKL
jgi:predicted transcriptional regulator